MRQLRVHQRVLVTALFLPCDGCDRMFMTDEHAATPYADLRGATLVGLGARWCPGCLLEARVPLPDEDALREVAALAVAVKRSPVTGYEAAFLRRYLPWSAEELAARADVPVRAVWDWEQRGGGVVADAARILRVNAAVVSAGGTPAWRADDFFGRVVRAILWAWRLAWGRSADRRVFRWRPPRHAEEGGSWEIARAQDREARGRP